MTENEMTISQYDMAVFKEQQAAAVRKHERAIARWQNGAYGVGFIAAAATVLGITYAIWTATAGPSAEQVLIHEEKLACIDKGMSWVKIIDSDDTSGVGTCIGSAVTP